MRQKRHQEYFTSADADILSGTPLEVAPGKGVLTVRVASTVNTATIAISSNGKAGQICPAIGAVHRANGEVRMNEDSPFIIPVDKGDRVTVSLGGTTGTSYVTIGWLGV